MMKIMKGGSVLLGTSLLLLLCLFVQEGQAKDKSTMKVKYLNCVQTKFTDPNDLKKHHDEKVTCNSNGLANSPFFGRCVKNGSRIIYDANTCFTETVREYNDDKKEVGQIISKVSGCSCTQGFLKETSEEVGKCIAHKVRLHKVNGYPAIEFDVKEPRKPNKEITFCNCVNTEQQDKDKKYCNKGGVKTTTPILLVSALVFIISSYWSHTHTHY